LLFWSSFDHFRAGKLPQIGEGIGKGIRNFKKATKDKEEIDVTPKKPEEISKKVKPAP